MKVDFAAVADATGFDLSDTEALQERLGQELTAAYTPMVEAVSGFASAAGETVRRVMSTPALKTAAAATAAAGAAAAAWTAVISALQQDQAETAAVNIRRTFAARDLAFGASYRLGDWWTIQKITGPTNPELIKGYKQSLESFEGQWAPRGIVFSAARGGGRRDVARPAYPQTGMPEDRVYMFAGEQGLLMQAPPLPSFKMAKDVTDCTREGDRSCDEFTSGVLGKLQKFVCVPFDFSQGCAIPARAWWVMCPGLGANAGWLGQALPWSPLAGTIAAGINSPSAWHLAIPSQQIRLSLMAILQRTGVLDLPEDPGQTVDGVFRQKNGVNLVLRGANAKAWGGYSRLVPGKLTIPFRGVDLQQVIAGHLRVLALRQALLETMPKQRPEIRAAAAASTDPDVKASVDGKRPETYWSLDDPLGLFRQSDPRPARQGRKPKRVGRIVVEPVKAFAAPDLGPPPATIGRRLAVGVGVLGGLGLAGYGVHRLTR